MHSLLLSIVIGTVFMCSLANASEYFLVNGKQGTKVDAVRALVQDSGAEVVRCVPQEMTEKLTLRAKKK